MNSIRLGRGPRTPCGVEACTGQQPDRGGIVGGRFGQYPSGGKSRIGGNLIQRRPKGFGRIALALVLDP